MSVPHRSWPSQRERCGIAARCKLGLQATQCAEIAAAHGRTVTLDHHPSPVVEHNPVDTAAARLEELVAHDVSAELLTTPGVHRSSKPLRGHGAEQLAFERKVRDPPLSKASRNHGP
jgi:hypothetical protein